MTFPAFPGSLAAMHEDPALMEGVFALAGKLDGKKMGATSWREARQYAPALSMAAMARNDYAVLMYDLWGAIYGDAGIDRIGHVGTDPILLRRCGITRKPARK